MQPVSEAYVESLWLEEAPEQAIILTIDADGLADPIRAVNYEGALAGTLDAGLVSNAVTYQYVPFTLGLVGGSSDTPAKDCKLELHGYDGQLEAAVDAATGVLSADFAVVRVDAPDVEEIAVTGARILEVDLRDPVATATIRPRDFSTEPAVAPRYTHARFPALY